MKTIVRCIVALAGVSAALVWLLSVKTPPAQAYVEVPYTLGRVIAEATNVMLLQVEKVDKERNAIIFRKVSDIKGKHPTDVIKHNIGRGGFEAREWQNIMNWAEPGKTAVFLHNGGASETCIDNYWYQAYAGGEWWNMSHAEPFFLRSFAGKPEKLAAAVQAMIAGQEVVVPCMVDGDKNALKARTARIQRLKASLKLMDYNSQRDFVGWGGDDFRQIAGMPGFAQYAGVSRIDPGAGGVAVTTLDGAKQAGFCFFGQSKVSLLEVGGTSLNEISLPYSGGARAADWADYNGDGKSDLLLATPSGPRLLTNLGKSFKDDTPGLPRETYYNATAAAWIDFDGDKLPDILLANGFLGLRLYRNLGPAAKAKQMKAPAEPPLFEDVSEQVGLGPAGLAARLKGDHLAVADFNGDARPDFLYSAGSGVMALNTGRGFAEAQNSGLAYQPGGVTPLLADFNGDGNIDVIAPQANGLKLYFGRGDGRFVDVTAKAGELPKAAGRATSAAAVDFDQDGKIDLFVGYFKGANRFFRNKSNGWFVDASDEIGLNQRVYNSRHLALADVNKDGALDMLLANEGQESAVILGSANQKDVGRVARRP
jgi:hypothetical protein